MKTLTSIENIHKIYDTFGSHPVLATCSDFQDWVCKYDDTKSLFNEFLAAKFANLWSIKVPEIAFVNIKQEHIAHTSLSFKAFEKECFGSLLLNDVIDVNESLIPLLTKNKNHIHNKEDLLKIALFDIWLANDDRTLNNNNLLLQTGKKGMNVIYAIDHVCIFNSSFLNQKIYDLNEYDTIMSSKIYKVLFGKSKKLGDYVDELVENFYIYIKKCNKELDDIVKEVPISWQIDTKEYKEKIRENIFSDDWIELSINNFREFIQTLIVT